jgi:fructokinase
MINKVRTATPSSVSSATGKIAPIVVFGEVLADIFPDRSVLGGAPFNVARHLKAFGLNPVLISRLGNDGLRDQILDTMRKRGMETVGVQTDNSHQTGQVNVRIESDGHHFEILPQQAYDFIHPTVARMTMLSVHPSMIYFGTLAQRHEISRRALRSMLRDTRAEKFLDINLRSPWYDQKILRKSLQNADIVKLNDEELVTLSEMYALQGRTAEAQVMDLLRQFGLKGAFVTCGAQGAWHMERNGNKLESAVTRSPSRIVDTVGAGDGFASVCILGAMLNWDVSTTLERAIKFAGTICEIRGAVPDDDEFYAPHLREWNL